MEVKKIENGTDLAAEHAKALQEWLNRELEKIVPAQVRFQAQQDERHVRQFLRKNHIHLEREGKTLNYVLMRKKKVLSRFVFMIRAFTENDLTQPANHATVTESPISEN